MPGDTKNGWKLLSIAPLAGLLAAGLSFATPSYAASPGINALEVIAPSDSKMHKAHSIVGPSDIRTRKKQRQTRRDMKANDKRSSHLITPVKPGRTKAAPVHLKNQYMRKAPTNHRPGAAINIRVNYIARKGQAGPSVPGHRPASTSGTIRISSVNYIARKSGGVHSPVRSSQQVSSRIAITGINYIARNGQAGSSVPGHRPASTSETIRISSVNYIARKHQ